MTRDETMARIAEAEVFFAAKRREAAIDEAVMRVLSPRTIRGWHNFLTGTAQYQRASWRYPNMTGQEIIAKRHQRALNRIRAEYRKLMAQGAPVAA